jgi:hypothetical protein
VKAGFLVGFGLLPMWAAFALIAFAFATMRSDQAGMTLWALVAAIPACAVTLSIAGVALAIHSGAAGDRQRKFRLSATFVGVACLVLVLIGLGLWLKKQSNDEDLRIEKADIEEFVKGNAAARAAAGEPFRVSISSYSIGRDGPLPTTYDVSVMGPQTIYAIVTVDRKTKPATFKLLCTTPLSIGQRETSKGPCAH